MSSPRRFFVAVALLLTCTLSGVATGCDIFSP